MCEITPTGVVAHGILKELMLSDVFEAGCNLPITVHNLDDQLIATYYT